MTFNANNWRKKYEEYSFEDQQRIYNFLETIRPFQKCFNLVAVKKFLKSIRGEKKILEIGGWKGELADEILQTDLANDIKYWHNYDICSNAIKKTICNNKKYKGIVLHNYFWYSVVFMPKYNVAILSHIIEHLSFNDVKKLVLKLHGFVKHIYVEAPITEKGHSWKNARGTHILKVGWDKIDKIMVGYKVKIYSKSIRSYEKK